MCIFVDGNKQVVPFVIDEKERERLKRKEREKQIEDEIEDYLILISFITSIFVHIL